MNQQTLYKYILQKYVATPTITGYLPYKPSRIIVKPCNLQIPIIGNNLYSKFILNLPIKDLCHALFVKKTLCALLTIF